MIGAERPMCRSASGERYLLLVDLQIYMGAEIPLAAIQKRDVRIAPIKFRGTMFALCMSG